METTGAPNSAAAAANHRQEMLRRLENWLDGVLASEPPPQGLDEGLVAELMGQASHAHAGTDAMSLWSAMTSLTQEVKLQGRSFQELTAAVGGQPAKVADEIRTAYRDREREMQREAERKARREAIAGLLDVRDSLDRGLQAARQAEAQPVERNWIERIFAPEDKGVATREALIKGYVLSLDRIDRMLEEWNVRRVDCLNEAFDPKRMNAVDLEETSAVADGTVMEVYRPGYEWNGETFRTAQVKVARAAAQTARN
ncbi:MAG: nucleotide exchange factor GrpE [Bryobacteraceae bacterium]